jgi:hypothetical protein
MLPEYYAAALIPTIWLKIKVIIDVEKMRELIGSATL